MNLLLNNTYIHIYVFVENYYLFVRFGIGREALFIESSSRQSSLYLQGQRILPVPAKQQKKLLNICAPLL